MILIIGGRAQGKLAYVLKEHNLKQNEIACCEENLPENVFGFKVVYGLNKLVFKLLEQGENPAEYILPRLCKHHIIICDEVGSGIVPMNKIDRDYRDAVGEICRKIASDAEIVERVTCGIATRIKG